MQIFLGSKLKYGLLASVLMFGCIVPASHAFAQAAGTAQSAMVLSPTSKYYTSEPGETVKGQLKVINDGDSEFDFTVYARPFSISSNDYNTPNFDDPVARADVFGWVTFDNVKYHAAARSSVAVNYEINIPQDAIPGGHYGVIFAEISAPSADKNNNSVRIVKRLGTKLYITVGGELQLAGRATGSDIPFWQFEPPLAADVRVENTGNTHFDDTVRLTVRDSLGKIKHQSLHKYTILPGTSRNIPLEWSKSPWFGLYKVQVEQKFLDKSAISEGYVLIMPRYIPMIFGFMIVVGGVNAAYRRKKRLND